MSLCIDNELIWVSVPRCASVSIEKSLSNSQLNIRYYKKSMFFDKDIHLHIQLKTLYDYFGLKESVCIKRDFVDRWLSGLEHWWWTMSITGLEPIIPFNNIDNNFIYTHFTDEMIDKMYVYEPLYVGIDNDIDMDYMGLKHELNTAFSITKNIKLQTYLPMLLISQKFWTNSKKCTYEFDFKDLNLFEEFISNRYSTKFELEHLNSRTKTKTKIVKDNKFENWIWEKFEKRFINNTNKII